MKIKDCEFGGEFQPHIKVVYEQLLLMVTCAEVNSVEWNYAWDLLRSHIDHFKYRQLEQEALKPQLAMPRIAQCMPIEQPPLECCNRS